MIGKLARRYPAYTIFVNRHLVRLWKRAVLVTGALLMSGGTLTAGAAESGNTLQAIDFAGLPGNKAQITLTLSNPAPAVEISLVRDDIDLPRVAADNRQIGRLAAEHFKERGFRNCLWVPFMDDLPNRERKDSQGICFLGKIRYDQFVESYLGTRRGEIREDVDVDRAGEMLTSMLFGLNVLGRTGFGQEALNNIVDSTLATLRA